ncbi:family 1 glycosylhydrolase, partial [Ralstonia pseudosolanacearum]|uniref:family 1 glycosylhydrolase n=1 Tax=Ralstonia pseudosolanacearum TaxID=1310165 RepID=UPI003CEB0204
MERSDFPADFTFGAASSALQIEGADKLYGKTPSVWDHYIEKYPDNIVNRATIDVACDSYHKFKEDIKMLKAMGATSYRFSISWTRILPMGKLEGGINWEGIDHYNTVLNELKCNGIEPFVTLLHFDSPQALEHS